jgi:hypothetical protein
MVLGRNLQQTRESRRVALDPMSYLLRNVLVDKQDGDVLALGGELVERCFDGRVLGLCVDDEEVLLCIWSRGDMLRKSDGVRERAS